jgi:nucleoside-diphosphate-sugar epimerase
MKKKIFITGANSFVGKRLIYYLVQNKFDVFGIDLFDCVIHGVKIRKADIRAANLEKFIPEKSIVIHLAAVSSEQKAKVNPNKLISINVDGTNNLIERCKRKKINNIIFASSEWIYGSYKDNTTIKENSNIINYNNHSLYSVSKLVGEKLLINSLDKIKNVNILRFGIIYGPRDNNLGALENLILNSVTKREVSVNSKKSARRYVFIDDVVSAILTSIDSKGLNIFNVSGNQLITLGKIFDYLEQFLKYKLIINENDKHAFNIRNMSNQKIKKYTKWRPKYSIQMGLKSLIKYYEKNSKK